MNDDRKRCLLRQFKELFKSVLLNRFGGMQIVIIQPGFPDTYYLGMLGQGFDPGVPVGLNNFGVMGMDPYSCKNTFIPVRNRDRFFNARYGIFHPDCYNSLQAGGAGPLNDFRPV